MNKQAKIFLHIALLFLSDLDIFQVLIKSDITKDTVATKGPWVIKNFGNNCYMNAIFQCLAEETSSLRSSPKEQVLAWLNVTTQYRRKGSKSGT